MIAAAKSTLIHGDFCPDADGNCLRLLSEPDNVYLVVDRNMTIRLVLLDAAALDRLYDIVQRYHELLGDDRSGLLDKTKLVFPADEKVPDVLIRMSLLTGGTSQPEGLKLTLEQSSADGLLPIVSTNIATTGFPRLSRVLTTVIHAVASRAPKAGFSV